MKYIWLDADPGHDDAIAILLAVHSPNLHLLGISTVHGNTDANCTARNAARCLAAFGAPQDIKVYPGASKPLLRQARHDPQIHGIDGLGGVEGFLDPNSPKLRSWFGYKDGEPVKALDAMVESIRSTWNQGKGNKVTVISSGPMTNIALFVSVYPELLDAIEEFVFMGGAVGLGNRSSVAEFNILCDPEAAQIVLDAPVKKAMMPLNVTHTAIVTKEIQSKLLIPNKSITKTHQNSTTNLRHTLSTLMTFFAESYKSTFGFVDGPPLHDPLTVAYVAQPHLFTYERQRVDVELNGSHTAGETVVDVWHYRSCDDSWGPQGRNCLVASAVNVDGFFNLFLECVGRCDEVSSLNKTTVESIP